MFAIVLLIGAAVNFSALTAGKEIIPWRPDLTAAQAEAARTHKPVLAYFTASWCGYCRQMARTTWTDAKVEQALHAYVPVKIDVDAQRDVAQHYGISGLPSYAILDDRGQVVRQGDGALSGEEFIAWLNGKQFFPAN
jgi:thiol:disulfide interchange protein DsbD